MFVRARAASSPPTPAAQALVSACLALVLLAAALGAQSDRPNSSVTRRPQDVPRGNLVYPQERGELQITVASGFARGEGQIVLPLSIEYGITGAWQIDAELETSAPFRRTSDAAGNRAGITGGGIGIQRTWIGMRGAPNHLAVGAELEVDRADDGNELALSPNVALGRDVGADGRAHLFAHAQAEVGTGELEPATSAGIIVPAGRTLLVAEWTRQPSDSDELQGRRFTTELTPGVILDIGEFELVAGAPVRVGRDSPRVGAILKLTREF